MEDSKASASRQNGEKSVGPITPEGKARSSANALKTGIFSQRRFIDGEDPAEFSRLCDRLAQDFKVVSALEYYFVDEIAMVMWRKRRLNQAEAAAIGKNQASFTLGFADLKWQELSSALALKIDKLPERDQNALAALRDDLAIRSRSLPADDEKFTRVAVSLDRSLERALRGLREAQQLRRASIEAIIVNARTPDGVRRSSDDESCGDELIVV